MGNASENQLNALDLLIEQHDEVDLLMKRLEEEELEGQDKTSVFFELADKLAAHAAMEEQVFYPAIHAKQTEELLLESTEEHLAIKRVLADMLVTDLDDPRFDALLSVLQEEVEHHAREEEEKELFPKLRKMMTGEELAALGGEMLARFEQLLATQPRNQVSSETDKPAEI
ncbi:MAG TPA: hemerythrin domain-containing protein [Kofleriaceae bacterium]